MARILVIDDNADLLQMIRLLLEDRGGHEVVLSAEGEDALAKAAANPPDMAIVDVMMPGMTGYEVCHRLRAAPATADIPIIILTARGQDVDREAALQAGADLYIPKPVTMSELLGQVSTLLESKGRAAGPQPHGLLAMLSLRGGVGTTTLAANVAATCVRQSAGACLVDFCPSSGNVALQMGLRPNPNWSDLAKPGTAIDAVSVKNYLLAHGSGLAVLAAPFLPVVGEGLSEEVARATLSALHDAFPILVVDLPSVLNAATMTVLEAADAIGLVLTADSASLQATVGTLQVLKPFADKIRLILNQVVPGRPPASQSLERVLRHPVTGAIPFDPAQVQALPQGAPLALSAPDAPLAQAVEALLPTLLAAR